NTVDATTVPSGAYIGGLPGDPGATSSMDGFVITNNIIKGAAAFIAAQSQDPNSYTNNSLAGTTRTHVTITGNQLFSSGGGSLIDMRGGAGSVDTVTVESNTLQNSAGAVNQILQDSHTTNATISNNVL